MPDNNESSGRKRRWDQRNPPPPPPRTLTQPTNNSAGDERAASLFSSSSGQSGDGSTGMSSLWSQHSPNSPFMAPLPHQTMLHQNQQHQGYYNHRYPQQYRHGSVLPLWHTQHTQHGIPPPPPPRPPPPPPPRQQQKASISGRQNAKAQKSGSDMEESSSGSESPPMPVEPLTSVGPTLTQTMKAPSDTSVSTPRSSEASSELLKAYTRQATEIGEKLISPTLTSKIRLARAQVMNARARLHMAREKRKAAFAANHPPLPPTEPSIILETVARDFSLSSIAALNQHLEIQSLSGSEDRALVALLPDVELLEGILDAVPVQEGGDVHEGEEEQGLASHDEIAEIVESARNYAINELNVQGEAVQKALAVLRGRQLALLKKKDERSQPLTPSGSVTTRESLLKRQSELKRSMESNSWKQSMLKQRYLLEAQLETLKDQQAKLETKRNQVRSTKECIVSYKFSIEECVLRQLQIEQEIVKTTKRVLEARTKREDSKDKSAEVVARALSTLSDILDKVAPNRETAPG